MRFDEFTAARGITVALVDEFPGFTAEAAIPPDWVPADSTTGMGIWICRTDPRINEFDPNAVLTMHRVATRLDPGEVFAMLSEQQLLSAPGSHELHREIRSASEGPGVTGVLALRIASEFGAIDSASLSRIIETDQETLIAQLTVTALADSPVERRNLWLGIRARDTMSTRRSADGGMPVGRDGRER